MPNGFGQKVLSLSLSALVLAWGTVPLRIQHAHVGGSDSTHQHDGCRKVAHHAAHDHDSDGEYHEHAAVSDVPQLAGCVVHIHLRWLGMELSQPLPEEPADGDDGDTVPPAIVGATDQIAPATHTGPALDRPLVAVICTPSVNSLPDLTPVPRLRVSASIPLSDSARFERSGVLLS